MSENISSVPSGLEKKYGFEYKLLDYKLYLRDMHCHGACWCLSVCVPSVDQLSEIQFVFHVSYREPLIIFERQFRNSLFLQENRGFATGGNSSSAIPDTRSRGKSTKGEGQH
ncbi:hypothetical protein CBL_10455 [Carabus blaptoides fortunei]